jgi:hypothetical protein
MKHIDWLIDWFIYLIKGNIPVLVLEEAGVPPPHTIFLWVYVTVMTVCYFVCFNNISIILRAQVVQWAGLPNNSYKPITIMVWVRAQLCILQKYWLIDWFIYLIKGNTPVLVLEEAGVPGENHRLWANNW